MTISSFLIYLLLSLQIGFAEPIVSRLPPLESETVMFLNQFPILRIVIQDAGGNGHQAAGITLIKRLREIGYTHPIEFLYETNLKSRLEFLLVPFQKDGPDEQEIPKLGVTAKPLIGKPDTHVGLTILAAPMYNIDVADFNTDAVITMVPPRWTAESPPEIHIAGSLWPVPIRGVPGVYPSRLGPRSPQHRVRRFLESQMSHSQSLSEKINGLHSLITQGRRERIKLLTAYGLGFHGVDRFVTLLRALNLLKTKISKPIVIGLLSQFNAKEWSQIQEKIASRPGESLAYQVFDIQSPDLPHTLERLPRNSIHIVKIGTVTYDTWNVLMSESQLPPTAAGSNGTNFLFQRGRPFLITEDTDVFAFDASLSNLEDESLGEDFLVMLKGFQAALDRGDVDHIASFYLRSLDPDSQLNRDFAIHADIIARHLPDRTCATILKGRDILEASTTTQSRLWRSMKAWLRSFSSTPLPASVSR